tara:strand:+ start:493 stop:690 length:198 start_codon:yes stop_codon:yes gene_type:complete
MAIDSKELHGVYVLTKDMTKENIDYWKNEMKAEYGSPDQYGNSKTVEFEETTEDDGTRYINFWVS